MHILTGEPASNQRYCKLCDTTEGEIIQGLLNVQFFTH